MKLIKAVPFMMGTGLLAMSLSAPGAQAQSDDMKGTGSGSGNASAADKMFVKKAMAGGMAEVELGQLAAEKGSSDEVKQFGQKMVDDHGKMNDQMKPIATQLGVEPPSSIPPDAKALEAKLKGLSGKAFDTAYVQAMVKDHRKDLMEFKKEASSGTSSAVKDAASQGSQVVAEHLKMAQEISKKQGASGMSPAAGGSGQP